jgi:hypothetical protein
MDTVHTEQGLAPEKPTRHTNKLFVYLIFSDVYCNLVYIAPNDYMTLHNIAAFTFQAGKNFKEIHQ